MFPLQSLSSKVPPHRLAGWFGVEAFGVLLPVTHGAAGEGIRFVPLASVGDSFNPEVLFQTEPATRVQQSVLRDHALVVRARGEFFSTDHLAVSDVRVDGDAWEIHFSVTHVESQDGEPATSDLYVVVAIDAGYARLRSLRLQFNARLRSFQGKESAMDEPAALPEVIEFLQ
jgi:hypothetical protein